MKKVIITSMLLFVFGFIGNAQLGKKLNTKQIGAIAKTVDALTLTDADLAKYIQEYVDWLDANNPICKVDDSDPGKKAYAERLSNMIAGIPEINDLKLDIKVYYVVEQNAFACANGSIRVFAGLMDIMSDDEILGVVGHEVGHIVNKDTKDAFRTALLMSALKDAVGSTSGVAAALSDSQLGQLGEALANAQFSQKQEYQADDYGYTFLKKNGKDPRGMASALRVIQKLQDEAGGKAGKTAQLFSTHPESGKRAGRLDEKYNKEN